jgi:hypothetical protein
MSCNLFKKTSCVASGRTERIVTLREAFEYETTHANGIESRNRERGANEAALPSLNYSLIQRMQKKSRIIVEPWTLIKALFYQKL